jgi:LuxR family maltose regulon positive regulatory protein
MVADAESALAGLARDDAVRPFGLAAIGFGYVLLDQSARADAILAEASAEAARLGASDTQAIAVGERSLIAAARDDAEAADTLVLEARGLVEGAGLDGYETSALALAASARGYLRRGMWDEARAELERAHAHGGRGTVPWLAVKTRIELGRAHVALREVPAVRSLLAEIRAHLQLRPHLGALVDQAHALEQEVDAVPSTAGASAGLTPAELRLLPFLTTHLSFREIGERLYVSRNTIKTQAISIYRKLGATSRSDAIAGAARLGLVEAGPPRRRLSPCTDDAQGRGAVR